MVNDKAHKLLKQVPKGKLEYDLHTEEEMRRAIAALLEKVVTLEERIETLEK